MGRKTHFDIKYSMGTMIKTSYRPIALGDATTVTNKEWEQWRQHGPGYLNPASELYIPVTLGGSDISIVFNVSPWTTSLELYHRKTGVQPCVQTTFNADSKALGHIYEDSIAEAFRYWYQKNYPDKDLKIVNDTIMYRHGKRDKSGKLAYPWAVANLDRRIWIDGKEGVLEIKMTSDRNLETIKKWQAGIVPIYYELQCRHYMAVMNVNYCYICCAWGLRLDQMAVVRINRDLKLERYILKECSLFVKNVLDKKEPCLDNCDATLLNEYYYRLYGVAKESAPTIELPESFRNLIYEALDAEDKAKELAEKCKDAEKRCQDVYKSLIPVFKDSSYGTFKLNDNQVVTITMKSPHTRDSFDEERFMAENPQDMSCDRYGIVSVNKTKLKKEEPVFYRRYVIPGGPKTDAGTKNTFKFSIKNV